jgi:hypothetical protein
MYIQIGSIRIYAGMATVGTAGAGAAGSALEISVPALSTALPLRTYLKISQMIL